MSNTITDEKFSQIIDKLDELNEPFPLIEAYADILKEGDEVVDFIHDLMFNN